MYAKLYSLPLQKQELSLKGWNWGRHEFAHNHLAFLVGNKQAFDFPMALVSNTTLASKNEVSVEFVQPEKQKKTEDSLVEMRFYVPGKANIVVDGEDAGRENDENDDSNEKEDVTAASLFYETIKEKADIGLVAGEELAKLDDILCLTPRSVIHLIAIVPSSDMPSKSTLRHHYSRSSTHSQCSSPTHSHITITHTRTHSPFRPSSTHTLPFISNFHTQAL